MKGMKCEDCVFYDELDTEQPCCGCVDFVNFECNHPTEKGETERQIQTAKTMIEKMVSCYDKTEKGGEG